MGHSPDLEQEVRGWGQRAPHLPSLGRFLTPELQEVVVRPLAPKIGIPVGAPKTANRPRKKTGTTNPLTVGRASPSPQTKTAPPVPAAIVPSVAVPAIDPPPEQTVLAIADQSETDTTRQPSTPPVAPKWQVPWLIVMASSVVCALLWATHTPQHPGGLTTPTATEEANILTNNDPNRLFRDAEKLSHEGNVGEAMSYYSKAATLGSTQAMRALGALYDPASHTSSIRLGLDTRKRKAYSCYCAAWMQGDATSKDDCVRFSAYKNNAGCL